MYADWRKPVRNGWKCLESKRYANWRTGRTIETCIHGKEFERQNEPWIRKGWKIPGRSSGEFWKTDDNREGFVNEKDYVSRKKNEIQDAEVLSWKKFGMFYRDKGVSNHHMYRR